MWRVWLDYNGKICRNPEFTHFTEFWTFNEVGVNHKEKVQVRKVEVSVVLEIQFCI